MRVFSFSGGRTSAYMTLKYWKRGDLVVYCNTGREHDKTLAFIRNFEAVEGIPIVWLEYTRQNKYLYNIVSHETATRREHLDSGPFFELLNGKKYLPNIMTRFCTVELKIKTIERFLRHSYGIRGNDARSQVEMFTGIRADEPSRYFKRKGHAPNGWYNAMPLFRDGTTKSKVLEFWASKPYDLGDIGRFGNCDLCYLKGMAMRVSILKESPETADFWAQFETPKRTFDKKISVEQLLGLSKMNKEFNFPDEQIECFCSID